MRVSQQGGGYVIAILLSFHSLSAAQLTTTVVERGPHHRVEHTPLPQLDWETGEVVDYKTNRIVFLANGMHYREGGQWVPTVERIEPYPEGAIAQTGPYKVIFSPNINVHGVIDLLTPDNKRLRFHPLALRWANKTSGERKVFARIKDSEGKILPPRQILYEDCFEGTLADMLYEYKKGAFPSDVVLRENPPLPEGWRSEDTRIEMVTEFVQAPEPRILNHVQKKETDALLRQIMAEPDLLDETIVFGEMRIPLGMGFLLPNNPNDDSVPVAKNWQATEGRVFLVETLDHSDLQRVFAALPDQDKNRNQIAKTGDLWPELKKSQESLRPLKIAHHQRNNPGFAIDFSTIVSQDTFYFDDGVTYCVEDHVAISDYTNFGSGAVIKYKKNSSLTLSGQVVTYSTVRESILTAIDDHEAGDLNMVNDELPPLEGYYATKALYLYYINDATTLNRIQVRHAYTAIQYYAPNTQHLNDCRIVDCDVGVKADWTTVYLDKVFHCDVSPLYQEGYNGYFYPEKVIPWCDILVNDPSLNTHVEFGNLHLHQQRESTIAVNGNYISVVYIDRGEDDGDESLNIGFSRSTDGGANFADRGPIPHGNDGIKPSSYPGDWADPISAWDNTRNYLYLVLNPPNLPVGSQGKLIFLRSTDNGLTYTNVITRFPPEVTVEEDFLDKPWVAVDQEGASSDPENGNIYCVFRNLSDDTIDPKRGVYFCKSTDFGESWTVYDPDPMTTTPEPLESDESLTAPFVTVGPNHEVYVFVFKADIMAINGFRSTDAGETFTQLPSINLVKNAAEAPGSAQVFKILERSDQTDLVRNANQPMAVVDTFGKTHLVYTDVGGEKTFHGQTFNDKSEIFLRTSDPQAGSWSSPLRVNDDNTANDQWNPIMTVKPDRSQLFIGFYDRRNSSTNTMTQVLGAIADTSEAGLTFTPNFQISDKPLLPEQNVEEMLMPDYDVVVADNNYYYFAWTDNRRIVKTELQTLIF